MSVGMFGVALALAVLFVYLDETFCAPSDKTGHLLVARGGDKNTVNKSVVGNRTLVKNKSSVGLKKDRDTGDDAGTHSGGESCKRKSRKHKKGFMEKMMPMMAIPFMVSTSMIPMMLISLKIMMMKSAFFGKIAMLLMMFNMFRRRINGEGGVTSHNISVDDGAKEYYGYHGDEEYGAYVNRRRRRRKTGNK